MTLINPPLNHRATELLRAVHSNTLPQPDRICQRDVSELMLLKALCLVVRDAEGWRISRQGVVELARAEGVAL